MTSNEQQWRLWPALEQVGRGRRWRLQCARAHWGGTKGADGTGWVEIGAGFDAESKRRAEALYLGDEDDPNDALIWHSTDGVHLAVQCRPTPADDGSVRTLLERRVLEFRNPRKLPPALLAFAMLPEVQALGDDAGGAASDLFLDERALVDRIETGCRELGRVLSLEVLTEVYARLLSDQRYVVLPEPVEPLTPAAFAVLLLPLPRDLADRLSMLSRLPSRSIDSVRAMAVDDHSTVRWHLLGLGNCPPDRLPAPTGVPDEASRRLAAALAHAVTSNDPTAVSKPPPVQPRSQEPPLTTQPSQQKIGKRIKEWWESKQGPETRSMTRPPQPPPTTAETTATPEPPPAPVQKLKPEPSATSAGHQLRIWGASSSGKTVYLARLFLKHRHGGEPRWRIKPPPGTDMDRNAERLDELLRQNRFPEPTGKDSWQRFDYRLIDEQTGHQATISMEDRPGAEYEAFDEETARRLATADGLMLLLDPNRKQGQQDAEVEKAFMRMQQVRADDDKDPRPLAVCISKSDELIYSADDYLRAISEPQEFLAEAIGQTISDAIHHYFASYRIFALSAVGLRIDHGAIEPGVFYDENLEPRPNVLAVPINLIEPLVWLLENMDR